MSLQNYQELEDLIEREDQSCLAKQGCDCPACTYKITKKIEVLNSDIEQCNNMDEFIKVLPVDFPIWISSTIIIHKKQSINQNQYHLYFNRREERNPTIHHIQLKSIMNLACQNIHLYQNNSQKIMTKFDYGNQIKQNLSFMNNKSGLSVTSNKIFEASYLQPYETRQVVRIQYDNKKSKDQFDCILLQYLQKQLEKKNHEIVKLNQQFLHWVYVEYNEHIFFAYLLELYVIIYHRMTKNIISSGVFYWFLEKDETFDFGKRTSQKQKRTKNQEIIYNNIQNYGLPKKLSFKPKLLNVKGLKIIYNEEIVSFDDQYKKIIMNHISKISKMKVTAAKNAVYNKRLDFFRSKVKTLYQEQQTTVFKKVEQQKQYQFQEDTDQLAKKLIPNMGKYKNLREILKTQQAFKEVFMPKIIKNKIKLTRKSNPLERKRNLSIHLTPRGERNFSKQSVIVNTPLSRRLKKKYEKMLTQPCTTD